MTIITSINLGVAKIWNPKEKKIWSECNSTLIRMQSSLHVGYAFGVCSLSNVNVCVCVYTHAYTHIKQTSMSVLHSKISHTLKLKSFINYSDEWVILESVQLSLSK